MTDPAAILEGPGTFADKCDALVGLVAALEAELAEAKDEIIKLRADIIWIAKDRDDNRQWAEDRATVAIEMADQRDQARQALAERTRERDYWKEVAGNYSAAIARASQGE
jgi:electron transfer flavoprotein alpha subunit